jgi:hypothetical protein
MDRVLKSAEGSDMLGHQKAAHTKCAAVLKYDTARTAAETCPRRGLTLCAGLLPQLLAQQQTLFGGPLAWHWLPYILPGL